MAVVNMDKWVSGEVETFFVPQQATTAAFADSKHDEETPAAQSQLRADLPPLPASGGYDPIMVVGAAFALIATAALVCFLVWMRATAIATATATAPWPAAAEKSSAPVETPAVKPILGQAPSDAGLDRARREMGLWLDHTREMTAPDRKLSPPRRAPRRRYWPSVRATPDHGEAARLMAAELRQMGITPVRRHK